MARPDAAKLRKAFSTLVNVLTCSHGILRGTAEAVLAEAQGLQIIDTRNFGRKPHHHLNDLQNAVRGLKKALATIRKNTLAIKEVNEYIYRQLEKRLGAIEMLAKLQVDLLSQVEQAADELKLIHHERLTGMSRVVIAGHRDENSLVSTQLKHQDVPLTPPGLTGRVAIIAKRVELMPIHSSAAVGRLKSVTGGLERLLESPVFVKKLAAAMGATEAEVTETFAALRIHS